MNRGSVCVFSERQDVALELLSAGRTLAGEAAVVSIVIGPDAEKAAREQIAHGADAVLIVEPGDGADPVKVQLEALGGTLARHEPDVVLIGSTVHGTEVAARFAQRHGLGCATECTQLEWIEGKLVVERNCLGRFVSRQVFETRPAIATLRPRRFEPTARDERRRGTIETLKIDAPPTRTPIIATRERAKSNVRIDKSDVVVGIGRGLRSEHDLRMIEKLAAVLGGVVGATRPLTDDLRWLAADRKVGLSGVTIKPKLYIACGISGQIEHNVGMRESGIVVAINNDPSAPIMQQADYCITADLHEIVPALIEAIGNV
ncbi:MAG: electron transfer flavoprotein subunit alpha/FixB family protein [Acidobacteriota bacterium]